MSVICPTVTATNSHIYRAQLEKVAKFSKRIHLDFADSEFTDVQLMDLSQAWKPEGLVVDLHMMFKNPTEQLEHAIKLKADLIILQAESEGNFRDLASRIKQSNIKVGIALLPKTSVANISKILPILDHVLIFSGHLGHQGGRADLSLLGKISEVKEIKPDIEIGWDGGINDQNSKTLSTNGVDVLNVGGFIQQAKNPAKAYSKLIKIVS